MAKNRNKKKNGSIAMAVDSSTTNNSLANERPAMDVSETMAKRDRVGGGVLRNIYLSHKDMDLIPECRCGKGKMILKCAGKDVLNQVYTKKPRASSAHSSTSQPQNNAIERDIGPTRFRSDIEMHIALMFMSIVLFLLGVILGKLL